MIPRSGGAPGTPAAAARALMAGRALLWPMLVQAMAVARARGGRRPQPAGTRALATTTAAAAAAAQASSAPAAHNADARPSDHPTTTSSLDAREARKFGALADKWWDVEAGPFAPLHAMNSARVAFIRDAVLDARRGRSSLAAATAAAAGTETREQAAAAAAAAATAAAAANEASTSPASATLEPLAGLRILDVGCGGGILAEPLARLGAQVVGIDAAREGVRAARAHAALDPRVCARTTYRAATAERLLAELEGRGGGGGGGGEEGQGQDHVDDDHDNNTTPDRHQPIRSPFDVVVASEVIEHVSNPSAFLSTLARLAHPLTGQVVISTLNRTAAALAVAVVGAERIARVVPPGTHDWHRFLTPQELAMLASDCGMEMAMAAGMVPDLRAGVGALLIGGGGSGGATGALLSTWRLSSSDLRINYIALLQQQHRKEPTER
jgi:ubiquinone biosynthesis O-methyltransferase